VTVLITRAECKTVRNMELALAREIHMAGLALSVGTAEVEVPRNAAC